MGEFRFAVGKTLDTSTNLIDMVWGNWTVLAGGGGGGWAPIGPTQFRHVPGGFGVGIDCIEYNNNVFTVGEWYRLYVTYIDIAGAGLSFLNTYPGDYTLRQWTRTNNSGVFTIDFQVKQGTKLRFVAQDDIWIQNLALYRWQWNDYITKGVNMEKAIFKVKKSDVVANIDVNFIENVELYGDAYDAMRWYLLYDCECPIKIEYRENKFNPWGVIYYGAVYVGDAEFNIENKTVKCDIEDDGGAGVLLKNMEKSIQIDKYHYRVFSNTGTPYHTFRYNPVRFHDPQTGIYPATQQPIFRTDRFLSDMVFEATEGRVLLQTSSLTNRTQWNGDGNTTDYLGVTTFRAGVNTLGFTTTPAVITTLKDVLTEYFKALNVWGYVVNGEMPEFYVDRLDLVINNSGLVFNDIKNVIIVKQPLPRRVRGGFKKVSIATEDLDGVFNVNTYQRCAEGEDDIALNWLGGNTNSQVATPLNNIQWNAYNGGSTYQDSIYLLEYYLSAGQYYTARGASFEYNPRFDPQTWLGRFLTYLRSNYYHEDDNRFNIYTSPNNFTSVGIFPYTKMIEFDYYMEMDDFLILLANTFNYITINSDNINIFTNAALNEACIVNELTYDVKTKSVKINAEMT